MLAAATARGELVALVDALDMLDVESAAAAGVDLDRLLWIRGHVVPNPGLCRDLNQRALEQAIRALTLVLQAGNFGLVAFDVAEAPPTRSRRLPFTTWLRLQRMVEGSQTVVRAGRQRADGAELGGADGAASAAANASVRPSTLFAGLDADARVFARANASARRGAGDVRDSGCQRHERRHG